MRLIKYLLFLIIGIIIFLLLNSRETFNIGVPWCVRNKPGTPAADLVPAPDEPYSRKEDAEAAVNDQNLHIVECDENGVLIPEPNVVNYGDSLSVAIITPQTAVVAFNEGDEVYVMFGSIRIKFKLLRKLDNGEWKVMTTDRTPVFGEGAYNQIHPSIIGVIDLIQEYNITIPENVMIAHLNVEEYVASEFNLTRCVMQHGCTYMSNDGRKYLSRESKEDPGLKYQFLDAVLLLILDGFNIPQCEISRNYEILYDETGYYGQTATDLLIDYPHDNYLFVHSLVFVERDTDLSVTPGTTSSNHARTIRREYNQTLQTIIFIRTCLLFDLDTQFFIGFNLNGDTPTDVVFMNIDITQSLDFLNNSIDEALEVEITLEEYLVFGNETIDTYFERFDARMIEELRPDPVMIPFTETVHRIRIFTNTSILAYYDIYKSIFETIRDGLPTIFDRLDRLGLDPRVIKRLKILLLYRYKWLIRKYNDTYNQWGEEYYESEFTPLDDGLDDEFVANVFGVPPPAQPQTPISGSIQEGIPPESCAAAARRRTG